MPTPREVKPAGRLAALRSRKALLLYAVVGLGVAIWYFTPAAQDNRFTATFVAKRGDLEITVVEGGSLDAQEKVEVKSEVEGQTKILSLVEEGYFVTPDDVESMKVLVELDATEIREKQTQQELQYQNTYAAFAQAREAYNIQLSQNESDIMADELAVKFAKMDFERYVGETVAEKILAEAEALRDQEEKDAPEKSARLPEPGGTDVAERPKAVSSEAQSAGAAPEPGANDTAPAPTAITVAGEGKSPLSVDVDVSARIPQIDFSKYADVGQLGQGEAGQRLRTLDNALVLSEKSLGLSESKLSGTQRLYGKQFVTKNDLEQDEMAVKRGSIDRESAEVAKDLFLKYDFQKTAQKSLADYEQAQRKLERTRQSTVSKIAQSEAALRSAEAAYDLQAQQRKKLQAQVEKCTIRATKPGLVVYGGGGERYWDNEHIEEGATVRERQVIITIPDTTRMSVEANIHEAYVKLVTKGQKVRVRADANRDRLLMGEVAKIAVLPNSENRWMSPDVKVYETSIHIEGNNDWLKPGMSAQVEIVAGVLKDVVYIPLDAVFNEKGERVCYVKAITGNVRRPVETGDFNDSFIEIKKGVEADEVVLLRAPEKKSGGKADGEKTDETKDAKPAGEKAAA